MEVQIISRESIKPSSPTPTHLTDFKLSLLDQLIPAPYTPLVIFYRNNGVPGKMLVALRKSLSEALTRFYPLAGVIREDDLSIDCNDHGAYFAVAEVNLHLSEFLSKPDILLIPRFLPCGTGFDENSAPGGIRAVTNIQVNVFRCGGIALGLCISHKILDGAALSTFLKSWAAEASSVDADSGEGIIFPDFAASSAFPTENKTWLRELSMKMWGSLFKKGKSKTRRFVFGGKEISALRSMAASSDACPTRVETISAFLWKCAMAAASEAAGGFCSSPSRLTHVVNLRRKSVPNLPEHSVGNLVWIAAAKWRGKLPQVALLPALANKVGESIAKINGDFVNKLRGGGEGGHDLMSKSLGEIEAFASGSSVSHYGFTSWCNLGFYEVDFGWGKPLWVSSVSEGGGPVYMNLIILMETRCGDGIEAWVTLGEQEMESFVDNRELRAFAETDPSPLQF